MRSEYQGPKTFGNMSGWNFHTKVSHFPQSESDPPFLSKVSHPSGNREKPEMSIDTKHALKDFEQACMAVKKEAGADFSVIGFVVSSTFEKRSFYCFIFVSLQSFRSICRSLKSLFATAGKVAQTA